MVRRRTELRLATPPPRDGVDTAPPPLDAAGGERLVAERGVPGLRAWLAASNAPPGGWLSFWRGYVAQFEDLGRAYTLWLEAEAAFVAVNDEVGLELTACGLVLVQSLNNGPFGDAKQRAERAWLSKASLLPERPLDLLRLCAWLLVAAEGYARAQAGKSDEDLLGRAFSALGGNLDPSLRLFCAASALYLSGRRREYVRAADFNRVGGHLAEAPEVGNYVKAVWHFQACLTRWHDPSVSSEEQVAHLDAVERFATGEASRPLTAHVQMLRALLAEMRGDRDAQAGHLEVAHRLLDPARQHDFFTYHVLKARLALATGDAESSLAHARLGLSCIGTQAPSAELGPVIIHVGMSELALGRLDEAIASFERDVELEPEPSVNADTRCHIHLTRALQHWRRGTRAEARAELVAGFAQARSIEFTQFFRLLPNVAAEVCNAALELDADSGFARRALTARSLPCPDAASPSWPWPLRVRVLGGFMIEHDGQPLQFGRKAPKRMLDLVRLIVALGGRLVDASRVAALLWPHAEAGDDRNALKTMLHRLRTLVGAELLTLREGQVSFTTSAVWLDTWAFEQVCSRIDTVLMAGRATSTVDDGELVRRRHQLLALYRGHAFGEGELPAWALPLRDRSRARFIRVVEALGRRLESTGSHEAAIDLYRAALEQDNLAEELYQRLIECHLIRGEQAQALGAYRRCRELLSIVLGLKPSARTQALANRIANR
jgi:DNA-binding SARP family transcriptional activator